jgi:hypothetical protein
MKKLITFLFLIAPFFSFSQSKLLKKIFSNDTTRHNSFLPVPVFGYSQEAGLQFGVAGIYSFYSDLKNPKNKASNIFGTSVYSTKKQSKLSLKSDIWSPSNNYHTITEIRIANTPFNFYGLGNSTLLANEDKIIQKQLKLLTEVERIVLPNFYMGIGAEYENLRFKDVVPGGIFSTNAPPDRTKGQVLYLRVSQLFDTRNNSTYPEKGFFLRSRFGLAPDFFGGNNFTGNLFDVDFRTFKKLSNNLILGFNINYEALSYTKNVEAFYVQPQLGGDQMMRGYYLGRFRGPNLIAGQAELRYRIVPRFGLVGFGGTGMVYENSQFAIKDLKPNYGIGARIFFDLEKALSLRLDYGVGEKPIGEKRISGFYLSLGEAF